MNYCILMGEIVYINKFKYYAMLNLKLDKINVEVYVEDERALGILEHCKENDTIVVNGEIIDHNKKTVILANKVTFIKANN